MHLPGTTTIGFTTPGTNYKGRIQYGSVFHTLIVDANSATSPTLTLDGTALTSKTIIMIFTNIICVTLNLLTEQLIWL